MRKHSAKIRWLHFTSDPTTFELDASAPDDPVMERAGIWLYKDYGQFRKYAEMWHEDAVVLEVDPQYVILVQYDEDHPDEDEYFLPAQHFSKAQIVCALFR